ncbi:PD-(D/E)XK nuclease family protein, partial [Enterococcus faecium]
LDWVVRELGADAGSTVAGLGTLIHAALEAAPDADAVALWEVVDARWNELGFESEWLERAGRERARDLVDRLAQYLRDFAAGGGELLA